MDAEQLDRLAALLRLRGVLVDDVGIEVELLSGGLSNLTYQIRSGRQDWVLRRPPQSHVLATAHDMAREFRVQAALEARDPRIPVPKVVLYCDDPAVIGSPFYVMQKVEGGIIRSTDEARGLDERTQQGLAESLVDALAALHTMDYTAVGLGDFGRPWGFTERQIHRWAAQLAKSRSREIAGIEELAEGLAASVPVQRAAALVHGDYRLDNCIVRGSAIVAVLDWEMAALGDPMADLAMFAVYYDGLSELPNEVVQSPGAIGAFPSVDTLMDRYASNVPYDVGQLEWYTAFAWFKFAVILEGIHFRAILSPAADTFAGVATLVGPAVDRGRAALARRHAS